MRASILPMTKIAIAIAIYISQSVAFSEIQFEKFSIAAPEVCDESCEST